MFRERCLSMIVIACIVLLTGAGCKQYYNGAIGISASERKAVMDYQRARQQRLADQAVFESRVDGSRSVGAAPHQSSDVQIDALGQVFEPASKRPSTRTLSIEPSRDRMSSERDSAGVKAPHAPVQAVLASPVSPYGTLAGERGVISPLDSPGQIRRISFTKEGADFDVAINATSDRLIYSSTRHRATADIYRQRIDGSAITQLTDDPSNDVMPVMSPDGKTIAFASDRSGNWDLYLMDADGGPAVQLTSDTTHDIHPSFSPDGKTLVYCSLSDRSGQWELVVIDIDHPTTKRYIGHGLFPQWSPGGRTILYQRARERGTRWFSVWTVELDERGEAGSPTEVVWSSEYACITPSWSPDGKALVFCTVMNPDADTQGRPAESDLWLARADGSGRTRLTRGRFSNLQPVWSGDNAIYFISNRSTGGVENIWAMDPNDAVRVAFFGKTDEQMQSADVSTPSD